MKNLILIIFILFISASSDSCDSISNATVNMEMNDPNFFKKELQESVMEFINDTGMNPDSSYIPFKDEF
jgi:hypothetical protein